MGTLLLASQSFILFFIYLFFIFISYFHFLFCFLYTYKKEALPSYLHSDSNRRSWLTWMNKKYVFIFQETKFTSSCLLWQELLKSNWCLLKKFRIKLFIFPMDTPCLLIRAISGLITMESDSGLLLGLAILNYSAPMAE